MRALQRLPALTERLLFGHRRNELTARISYMLLNFVLILGVFFILLNNIVYDWTGALYSQGFHLNTPLDNIIPFAPTWAIFYLYLFYPLSAMTMIYFAFIERRLGYALAWSLVIITLISDAIYVVFPVTMDIYRAQLLAHPIVGNSFATAMYQHYATDPSFNCFPSLHAAIAVICFYAWYRFARERRTAVTKAIAIFMAIIAVGVMLSTLFVKQHYVADEIAGFLLAWGVGAWMYGRRGVAEPAVRE